MSGKPASRIGDGVVKGVIVQGSATVLIGSLGGKACSVCPGGMAVGSPVNPALGAKVLSGETDFALPAAAFPLVWQRSYSSYVNAEHGGACGLLGYGWTLPQAYRVRLEEKRTLLFDTSGRVITFDEALPPGGAVHSRSESIWLLRGGVPAPVRDAMPSWLGPAWRHVPREWADDPQCVMAASGSDKSILWRFVEQLPGVWLPVEQRDRLGARQYFRYSLQGEEVPPLLTDIIDGAGRQYQLSYRQFYPARESTPGLGEQAGWQADHGWRLVQVGLVNGLVLVRYDFDEKTGDLVRVRNRHDITAREFGYRNHLLVAHRGRDRLRHQYVYEADVPGARVLEQHNEQGISYRFAYEQEDAQHSTTTVTDSLGRTERYHFKGRGGDKRLMRHQRADGSTVEQVYDVAGHLTGITNPLGRKTRLFRDGEGRMTASVDAANNTSSRVVFDDVGRIVEEQDAAGRTTQYQFDGFGRLTRVIHPDETREEYHYPAPDARLAHLPVRFINAKGGTQHFQWNAHGQLERFTDCSNRTTQYQYGSWGELLRVTNALDETVRYEYDAQLRRIATYLPDGSIFRYAYDDLDQLTEVIRPDESTVRHTYDAQGRLTQSTNPAGYARRFEYDSAGRLVAIRNENGERHRLEYDVMDRLVREVGFDRRTQGYQYDAAGQLIGKVEESLPGSPVTRFEYDIVGRLVARHIPRIGTVKDYIERFEWSPSGRLLRADSYGNKVEFQYNTAGQVAVETFTLRMQDGEEWEWTQRHGFNELGVRKSSLYGELPAIQWLTYGSGHLHGVRLPGFSIDFERDKLHREIERNFRTPEHKLLMLRDSHYNALGQVMERHVAILGKPFSNKRYGFDALGQLGRIRDSLDPHVDVHYRYDPAGRLIGSQHGPYTHHYALDPAGNRIDPSPLRPEEEPEDWRETVRRRMHDPDFNVLAHLGPQDERPASRYWADNRITELDGIKNTFDGAGNLVERIEPDKTRFVLQYDGAHRLVTLFRYNPDGTSLTAWYGYDAFSRRICKGVIRGEQEEITRYGWDGDRLVYEETKDRRTTIIYEPGSFIPLARVEQAPRQEPTDERERLIAEEIKRAKQIFASAGMDLPQEYRPKPAPAQTSVFLTDHAGTPLQLVDAEGEVIWTAEADDWAAVIRERGVRQPIRFQGQWLDEESGFFYNRYRYYDSKLGRYITADPIGLEGGVNGFVYPENPVGDIDPLGLETCLLTTKWKILGIGDHSALYISRGYSDPNGRNPKLKGGAVLFDPGGGYHSKIASNIVERTGKISGGIIDEMVASHYAVGSGASIERFKKYHRKDDVGVVCKDTTEEEEKEFYNKLALQGSLGWARCAGSVGNVIMDSKAFPGVKSKDGGYTFPGSLERAAKK